MQRVAIARALVNDPDILLADEPTGALDSDTSVQVMELLREVAKDRLVVMVTHNPELADQYATRIVRLRDGKIRADSDPYEVDESALAEPEHKNMGKSSMSFATALALSFNNLRTKKARTLLTSFAGSIGIIGIALILSLSTGVNQYIKDVERETLSEYPLQIQSTGFDFSSMVVSDTAGTSEDKGDIQVIEMVTDMFSTMNSNDLESLKKYLDGGESGIDQYTNAIEYSYNVVPQIYRQRGDDIRQVNPDRSFESLGFGSSAGANSMMSTMMSTDVFYQMPASENLYEGQYDVKAGRWPESYNECVVVLTSGGGLSDFMLYTLGLRDPMELDEMIRQFIDEETVTTPENDDTYSYEDIVGLQFKLVNSADCYEYDSEYKIWRDKTDNTQYMKDLVENGEDLTIVGVVQPAEGASAAALTPGIAYPASLTEYVAEQAAQSEIVKQQLADKTVNVFTNDPFGETDEEGGMDMNSLFTVDTEALADAFQFDESALSGGLNGSFDVSDAFENGGSTLDLSGLVDLSEVNVNLDDMPELDLLSKMAAELSAGYLSYAQANGLPDPSKMGEYFLDYLGTGDAQNRLSSGLADVIDMDSLEQQVGTAVQSYMAEAMGVYTEALSQTLETQITSAMGQITSQITGGLEAVMQQAMTQVGSQLQGAMENALSIDEEAFAEAFQMNMNEEELSELMMSMNTAESATYEGNLQKLGYVDFDEPSMISLYPTDFESKESVVGILDDYNSRMESEGQDEQVITYTDVVGTLMSSVTDIIDVITYVLIAFVAISLVVSSIMIGVITYISVLERKKEIGILRAIGASKGNISQVFNAETFIIGLCAGLIGIGITLLLLIPGNALIHYLAGTSDINAVLPAVPAVILILLSVGLTLVGGLIPSSKAAKSDPVTALRTE